jgi:hypothetical protein
VVSAIYKASPLPVPDGAEFDLFQDFNLLPTLKGRCP